MHTPLPQVDEFSKGHAGRLRVAFQRSTLAAGMSVLRRQVGSDGANSSIVELLAHASGLEVGAYAARHSMLPFSAIVSEPGVSVGDCSWNRSVLRYKGMNSPREGAYLCPKCTAVDMASRRYSYWRRSHQLPGTYRCVAHDEPLRCIEDADAFAHQPVKFLASSKAAPLATDRRVQSSATVGRFQRLSQLLLTGDVCIAPEACKELLAKQASAKGVRIWMNGRLPLLSDRARSQFPLEWLADVLPGLESKDQGQYFSPLDNAVRPAATTTGTAVCLALAALFDSADEAFSQVAACRERAPTETRPDKPTKRPRSPQRLYCELGGRLDLVAAELGVSEEIALARLLRGRAELLRRLGDTAEFRALQRFASVDGLGHACQEEGASLEMAENILRLLIAEQGKILKAARATERLSG